MKPTLELDGNIVPKVFPGPPFFLSGQFYWEGEWLREKGNVPTLTVKAQAAEQKTGFLFI